MKTYPVVSLIYLVLIAGCVLSPFTATIDSNNNNKLLTSTIEYQPLPTLAGKWLFHDFYARQYTDSLLRLQPYPDQTDSYKLLEWEGGVFNAALYGRRNRLCHILKKAALRIVIDIGISNTASQANTLIH